MSDGREFGSRRRFLGVTASATAGAAAYNWHRRGRAHAAVSPAGTSDVLRVALVGCGGRGSGAAAQALEADPNTRLVALGDAFEDRLEGSLARLMKNESVSARVDVPKERRFVGFDAYKGVLEAGVDVVLLATPPHFRPQHLAAAVAAGKHVFAEKPVAVDPVGVRSVLASCEEAKRRGLAVVSGLCWRYDEGARELVRRVHGGAIGEVRAIHANDFRGPIWVKPRLPDWTDMEYQMRNWYYFTWLSGDFNVEQHVHFLDLCAWILKDQYPVRATGTGGRTWRTAPEYGNIYDHHAVTYEYASGLRVLSHCRQYPGAHNDSTILVVGTKGTATFADKTMSITSGRKIWQPPATRNDKFLMEHSELFASIRKGKPINNGDFMSKSTLMGIIGRMATYTGQLVLWDEAAASAERLGPDAYDWKAKVPAPPVPVPGAQSAG